MRDQQERDRAARDGESADDWAVAECGVRAIGELGCDSVAGVGAAGGAGDCEVIDANHAMRTILMQVPSDWLDIIQLA